MHQQSLSNLNLYLIAGPNGSGKTTSYELLKTEGMLDSKAVFINPDVYAKELANSLGYKNVNELPLALKTKLDLEAGKRALLARANCFKQKQNMIIETTASSRGTLRLINEAKAQGYQIKTIFIILQNAVLNILRIKVRAKLGGHYVEPDIVKRRFAKAQELLGEILAFSDEGILLDNTESYEVVLTKEGNEIKTYPNEVWDKQRLDSLIQEIKSLS